MSWRSTKLLILMGLCICLCVSCLPISSRSSECIASDDSFILPSTARANGFDEQR
jgi:hypothetical protein